MVRCSMGVEPLIASACRTSSRIRWSAQVWGAWLPFSPPPAPARRGRGPGGPGDRGCLSAQRPEPAQCQRHADSDEQDEPGLITNTYLSAAEYDLLASLPADVLSKTRLIVAPLSVDVLEPPLDGLVMADVEFSTDEEARSFRPPPAVVAEVTDDPRFTGGSLVQARRHELLAWLAGYGIEAGQAERTRPA
jgi:hypothetical protein